MQKSGGNFGQILVQASVELKSGSYLNIYVMIYGQFVFCFGKTWPDDDFSLFIYYPSGGWVLSDFTGFRVPALKKGIINVFHGFYTLGWILITVKKVETVVLR